MKITILGKGAWGKALGDNLVTRGHEVHWVEKGGREIPKGTELIWIALPTQVVREVLQTLRSFAGMCPVVNLSKGIEISTGQRVSEIVGHVWPGIPVAVVSGPSLAAELAQKMPTALVAAAQNEALAASVQSALHGTALRVYRSTDLAGVEWGGALKNVYALAAGMCVGLGLGENSLAGLTTRSLRVMTRVAVQFGARVETLQGLSGIGDLLLTSYSRASRNRRIGECIGKGDTLEKALSSVEGVCEGVWTTQALHKMLARKHVEAPVAHQLYQVLFEGKSPKEGLTSLLDRDSKAEAE